jgi:hypothetical protein
METVIGFIIGYLVGSREGKEGIVRLRTSADAIIHSTEVRRLTAQAITIAESATKDASSRGLGSIGAAVARNLLDRAPVDNPRDNPHAA